MKGQGLRPGVQHGNGPWGRSQPALTYGVESLKSGLEEQGVAPPSVDQEQGVQGFGHREHEVEVRHREQVAALGLYPTSLLQALTLGAMTVATGVVERLLATTPIADLEMTPQFACSTPDDVSDHPTAVTSQLLQGWSMGPEDLCELRRAALQGRQGLPRRSPSQRVQRAARLAQVVPSYLRVALR